MAPARIFVVPESASLRKRSDSTWFFGPWQRVPVLWMSGIMAEAAVWFWNCLDLPFTFSGDLPNPPTLCPVSHELV
jgi:hypothetical protein